ncbi:MAG: biosynthetic arginine decarboxylase [Phycisphaerales bacterium]|nr:biosynthetic arginine decarboxylase [Phycisphaerales bacterium]
MTTIAKPGRGVLDPAWTIDDAVDLYDIEAWGKGYFSINSSGHVVVRPTRDAKAEIDLTEVIDGLKERDIHSPVLLRFNGILQTRLQDIAGAFRTAMAENEYRGAYRAVYPVKVNQQRLVVEEVYRFGKEFEFGLEVGSKPELLAVLGMTPDANGRLIVCNGFKDDKYIEAVILATKLGRNIIPVVESFHELLLIAKYAQKYDVRPKIGVRVKLASQGVGRWKTSAGARSKFGLFVSEILRMVDFLKERDMADCLQLLHCHIGSQIYDIRHVKTAVNELAHVYVELVKLGAGLKYMDVGGGMGVDYDGSQTNFESSMNYTLVEYASDVVYRIKTVCEDHDVEHPTIVTECGRAMVAYHSILVFNVLGSSGLDRFPIPQSMDEAGAPEEEIPQPIYDLFEAYNSVGPRRLVEAYHDAMQARDEAMNLFNLGYMTLRMRGMAERLFWGVCAKVRDVCRGLESVPEEFEDLEVILSDTYFCNFSLFQSLPDSWAVDQIFPVIPLQRLNERPTRQGVLADITCDSDGKIDRFVDRRDIRKTLELHEVAPGEEYYLGAFLVGAYQETLGDLHNLFGDTHVVHLSMDDSGDWSIDELIEGDKVRSVLGYVQYDVDKLEQTLRRDCEQAVKNKRFTVRESQLLLRFYKDGLESYTYLEPGSTAGPKNAD